VYRGGGRDNLEAMNQKLAVLLQRVAEWPEAAQDEAVRALAAIEEKQVGGNLSDARSRIARSLADPRPDIPLDQAFDNIELLHAQRLKARGDVA
jgi:hypothetical protein